MWAAQYGYGSVVEMLITAGANLDIHTDVGCLLDYTMQCNALEIHGRSCVALTCL